MSTATKAPNFARGGEVAEEIAAANSGGSAFRKQHYLQIDDGETQVVRYITDSPEWITVKSHAGVPTKNPPAGHTGNWPKSMSAVCRYDDAFKGIFDDCYVCDRKLTDFWGKPCNQKIRVWALACLREEVIGTQEMADAGEIPANKVGKRAGFKDAIREYEVDGVKGTERALVVVNQPVSNYFAGLQAIYKTLGSVADRDIAVSRKGEGKDSEYHHIAFEETPNLAPGTESWSRYDKAVLEQGLDLGELVFSKASDDYYADLFDPSKVSSREAAKTESGASSSQQNAAPSNDAPVDEDRRQAIRDRVKGVTSPSLSEVD